jgi:hypothetical protein
LVPQFEQSESIDRGYQWLLIYELKPQDFQGTALQFKATEISKTLAALQRGLHE